MPLIQTLVNKTWFQGKKDDWAMHSEFFEGEMLSLSTIALVLTVVSLLYLAYLYDSRLMDVGCTD